MVANIYKMVIADDDEIIRRGLEHTVDWGAHHIQIVGTAANGKEAWEMVQCLCPHIVLSDIKMPFMDGIELSENVHREYPDIQLILLSAYEEFDYAKRAMKYGVCDYLLKPIDSEKLLEAVLKSASKVDRAQASNDQMRQSAPLLKTQFFKNLLEKRYGNDEFHRLAQTLNLHLDRACYVVAAVLLSDYTNCEKELNGSLLRYAVENIAKEIISEISYGEVFHDSGNIIHIVLSGGDEAQDSLYHEAQHIAAELGMHVNGLLHSKVIVGIGNVYNDILCIGNSSREADYALEYRHIREREDTILFSNTGEPDYSEKISYEDCGKQYAAKTIVGNLEDALCILETCKSEFTQKRFVSLGNIHLWSIALAALLFKEISCWGNVDVDTDYYNFCHTIRKTDGISEVFCVLEELTRDICDAIHLQKGSRKYTIIKEAEVFVERNFADSSISQQVVADQVGVSSVYLSIAFKQIKKINFSDYIYHLRMNMAEELACNTIMKACDIGEQVGYSNTNYFYLLFKKRFGCSIGEYRKKRGSIHDRN